MFHFTIVVSLSMKQKSRNKHHQFDGTLVVIILKKICDTCIILQGFSYSSIFVITFSTEKAYFGSKLQNSAREKKFQLGDF
jgi:hypothetical protein